MCKKGYSVYRAKKEALVAHAELRKQVAESTQTDTGSLFVPLQPSLEPVQEANMLFGINVTFPNGTVLAIKRGNAKSIMQLMKLYEKEDLLCLD